MLHFLVTPGLAVAVQPCMEWIPIKKSNYTTVGWTSSKSTWPLYSIFLFNLSITYPLLSAWDGKKLFILTVSVGTLHTAPLSLGNCSSDITDAFLKSNILEMRTFSQIFQTVQETKNLKFIPRCLTRWLIWFHLFFLEDKLFLIQWADIGKQSRLTEIIFLHFILLCNRSFAQRSIANHT